MPTAKQRAAMSKMSPAQKRGFRKLMASRGGKVVRRRIKRRRVAKVTVTVNPRRRRRRRNPAKGNNPMHALVANPRKRRRRRRKAARRASPRRRRRYNPRGVARIRGAGYKKRRRVRRIGRVRLATGKGRRRRYATKTLYTNPRRRARRRNPRGRGFGAAIKSAFTPYAAGFVMSMITSVTDQALAKSPAIGAFSKIGLALGTAYFLGRRYPMAAAGAIGSLAASTGYEWGTKLAGGLIIRTPEDAVEAQNDIGVLLNGMGILTGMEPVDQAVTAYESALYHQGDGDY